jgi:hypothetical protein
VARPPGADVAVAERQRERSFPAERREAGHSRAAKRRGLPARAAPPAEGGRLQREILSG